MIKSLFRQMWNQRHANVWVWVELVVVLVLLWYSIDLVYNYEVAARQSKGYDTENVFDIQLNIKPALQNDSVLMSHSAEYLEQIYHLIQQYQGVEEACFYYLRYDQCPNAGACDRNCSSQGVWRITYFHYGEVVFRESAYGLFGWNFRISVFVCFGLAGTCMVVW